MAKSLSLSREQLAALDERKLRKTLRELQGMADDTRRKHGREQAAAQLLVVQEVIAERALAKKAVEKIITDPPTDDAALSPKAAILATPETTIDPSLPCETLPQTIPEILSPDDVIAQYEQACSHVLRESLITQNRFNVPFDPLWRMRLIGNRLRWGVTSGPNTTTFRSSADMGTDVVLVVLTPDSDAIGMYPLFQGAQTAPKPGEVLSSNSMTHLVQPWRLTPEWAGIAIAGLTSEVHVLQAAQNHTVREPNEQEQKLMKTERFGSRTFAAEALSGGTLRETMERCMPQHGIEVTTSAPKLLFGQPERILRFAQEVCLCINQVPPLCEDEAVLRISTVYHTLIRLQYVLGATGNDHEYGPQHEQVMSTLAKQWIDEIRARMALQKAAQPRVPAPAETLQRTVPEILEPKAVIEQYDVALARLLLEAGSSTSQFGPPGNLFERMTAQRHNIRWGITREKHDVTLPMDTDPGKHTLLMVVSEGSNILGKYQLFRESLANMQPYQTPTHYPIAHLVQPYRLTSEWAAVAAAGPITATQTLQTLQGHQMLKPDREQRKQMRSDSLASQAFAAEVLSKGTLVPTIERSMAAHGVSPSGVLSALMLAEPARMLKFFQDVSGCVTAEPPLCVDEAYVRIIVSYLSCIRFQFTKGGTQEQQELSNHMRAAMWEMAEAWIQEAYPHLPVLPEDERRRPMHEPDTADAEATDPELANIPPSVVADVRNARLGARLEVVNRSGGDPGEACKALLAEELDQSDPQVRMMLRAGAALDRWRQDASLMATLKAHTERLMSLQPTQHRRSIDLRSTAIADDNCPLAPQLVSRLLEEMHILEGWGQDLSAEDIAVTLSVIVQLMRKLETQAVIPNGGHVPKQMNYSVTRGVIYSILRHLTACQPNTAGAVGYASKAPSHEYWNIGHAEYLAWQPQSSEPIRNTNMLAKSSLNMIGCKDALRETEMLRQITGEFAELYPPSGRHRRTRNGADRVMNIMTRVPGTPEKHLVMSTIDTEKGTMLIGRSPSEIGLQFGDRIPLDNEGTFPAMLPCVPSYTGDDNAATLKQLEALKATYFQTMEERLSIVAPELLTQPESLRVCFFLCDGERTTVLVSEANRDKVTAPPSGFHPQETTEAIVDRTGYLSKQDPWLSFELPTPSELDRELFTGTQVSGSFLQPNTPTSHEAPTPTAVVTRCKDAGVGTVHSSLPRLPIVRDALRKLRQHAEYCWDDGTPLDPQNTDFGAVAAGHFVVITLTDLNLQFIVSNDGDRGTYVVHSNLEPQHYTSFDAEDLHNHHGCTDIRFDNPDQFRESVEMIINTQKTSPRTVYPVNCAFANPLKDYSHLQADQDGQAEDLLALDTLRADFAEAAAISNKQPWDLVPDDFHSIKSGTILWRFGGNGAGGTYLERLARELGIDAGKINEDRRNAAENAGVAVQAQEEAHQRNFRLAALLFVQHELYPTEMLTSPVQDARRGRWQRQCERAAVRVAEAGQTSDSL